MTRVRWALGSVVVGIALASVSACGTEDSTPAVTTEVGVQDVVAGTFQANGAEVARVFKGAQHQGTQASMASRFTKDELKAAVSRAEKAVGTRGSVRYDPRLDVVRVHLETPPVPDELRRDDVYIVEVGGPSSP